MFALFILGSTSFNPLEGVIFFALLSYVGAFLFMTVARISRYYYADSQLWLVGAVWAFFHFMIGLGGIQSYPLVFLPWVVGTLIAPLAIAFLMRNLFESW